jgi:hypothetical protein
VHHGAAQHHRLGARRRRAGDQVQGALDVCGAAGPAVVPGELAEQDLGLGRTLAAAGGQQAVPGAGEQLLAGALAVAACPAGAELDLGAVRIVGRPQLQRPAVVARRGGVDAQRAVTRSPASRSAIRVRRARSSSARPAAVANESARP